MDRIKKYDLIVIGAGSGLNIVSSALKKKKKIALIENDKMGGTCLNRGCIPSKAFLFYASLVDSINFSKFFFIDSELKKIDYKKIVYSINRQTNKISKKILSFYKKNKKVDFFQNSAKFIDNHSLQVGKKTIYGEKIVLAIGAKAFIPKIKGLDKIDFLTYKEAFHLDKLPKDLIIIGGGYIGIELSKLFSSMGVQVTILESKKILSNLDQEITKELKKELLKKVKLYENITIKNIKKLKNKVVVHCNNKTMSAEKLLIATGLQPNTDVIQIEKTSIKLDKKGFIKVDSYLRSNVKHIYALGDCINSYFFKHSANFESNYIAYNLFKQNKSPIKYPPMGYCVFCDPEIAGVGKNLTKAKKAKNLYIKSFCFKDTASAIISKKTLGKIFLIFEKKSKILKGAHIVGDKASILIHVLIAFMQKKAKEQDIKDMIFIHPTIAEVIKQSLS